MKKNGNFVDKLERKFGKYAVPHLMKYMVVLYIIGFFISAMSSSLFVEMLTIDFEKILKGQVWRLVTFAIAPPLSFGGRIDFIFVIFALLLYYSIGNTLEAVWGTFRFNVFYFSGLAVSIISALLSFIFVGSDFAYLITTDYIFLSMFLAYAMIFPNEKLYIYMILPIKIKWLGILDALLIAYKAWTAIQMVMYGEAYAAAGITILINIACAMINFFVLFNAFKTKGMSSAQRKKSKEYKKKVNTLSKNRVHTCTTCGATSKTHPDMEFRFCSRCDGNREYCTEHLFTHEHVKKLIINIDKDEM